MISLQKKSVILVTDVPTPYRNHHYAALFQKLKRLGISFEVYYMALTVPIRYWEFDKDEFSYPYRIFRGVRLQWKGNSYHFNPGLILAVLRKGPGLLLIGGAWNIPSSFLSLLTYRFLKDQRCKTFLWSEANKYSVNYDNRVVRYLRKLVVRHVDGYVVPGRLAAETIRDDWGEEHKPFFKMPNLIDNAKFSVNTQSTLTTEKRRDAIRSLDISIDNDSPIFLWPARLHEATKGIINFLSAVRSLLTSSEAIILIAGDGLDRSLIAEWVERNVSSHTRLIGQKSESEMLELYRLADALLLPSLKDPNPLTVIEGLWSSKPILISTHCGNQFEAVRDGHNGWVVDPRDEQSMRKGFESMLGSSKETLLKMGQNSFRIAEKEFNSNTMTDKFIREIFDAG